MSVAFGLSADFVPAAYDAIVVGAGFAGAVCARCLAEGANMRVAVIERRSFVGGNAHDLTNDDGVLVHAYGPHIYHTSDERVHQFLSRFCDFTSYRHKALVSVDGSLMPMPFNRQSLRIAFGHDEGERLHAKLVATFGEQKRVSVSRLLHTEDPDMVRIARYVYDDLFTRYATKQWGLSAEQIDQDYLGRVAVVVGDDDDYFPDATHQGLPLHGYSILFSHMLDHDLISVFLECDACDVVRVVDGRLEVCGSPYGGEVIYTGSLDELFGADLGPLAYRTLEIEFQTLNVDWYQPVGVVSYAGEEPYTRVTEYKHLTGQDVHGKTTIACEIPGPYVPHTGQVPYYAVRDDKSEQRYQQYRARVENVLNLHVVGRLAEYRYYDMDGVVSAALTLSDSIMEHR
ncbi:MAG: UDP-galactopyranose mutase [Coriobacteriales bacterium]|nr:UDP-galactopyranose mutase [Coriobacteriales bacterium]